MPSWNNLNREDVKTVDADISNHSIRKGRMMKIVIYPNNTVSFRDDEDIRIDNLYTAEEVIDLFRIDLVRDFATDYAFHRYENGIELVLWGTEPDGRGIKKDYSRIKKT